MRALRAFDKRRARWAAIAAACAIGAGLIVLATGAFGGVERGSRELRFSLRSQPKPSNITVVAIDDVTFAKLGLQWPFKRHIHAEAIDALRKAGAREIVYDVQFTEPTQPREDQALTDAVGRAGNVVLATTEEDDQGRTAVLGGDDNLRTLHARAGAANLIADKGGTITRFRYSISHLKTLAVTAAERAGGPKLEPGRFGSHGAWIDYAGAPGTFRTLSFANVVRGRFDPSLVRGRIVVVGTSDPTLQDVHSTPVGGARLMSGPEVQANAIETALNGVPLQNAPAWLDLLAILALGLAIPLLRLRTGVVRCALATPLVALGFLALGQFAFDRGTMLREMPPLVALAIGGVTMVVVSYLVESFERQRIARQKELLEGLVRQRTEQVRETQLEVIWRLSQLAESRDRDTGLHIERISSLTQALALKIGMSPEQAELIGHAAALHDVGKIGIPDRILLSPDKLAPADYELMKTHTEIGANVLGASNSPLVKVAESIARSHHEHWDGSGYPDGLAGTDIPLAARICSVCDVFDALVSERAYKSAWSVRDALAELRKGAGTNFDPALVNAFARIAASANDQLRAEQIARRARGESGHVPQLIDLDRTHAEPVESGG